VNDANNIEKISGNRL